MTVEVTQTILQYNGVRLQNVQTLEFIETPQIGEGGAYLYTETMLKVLGYFTTDKYGTLGVHPNIGDSYGVDKGATQQFKVIKNLLEAPRCRLVYSVLNVSASDSTDTVVFEINPAPEEYTDAEDALLNMKLSSDVCGGPIPLSVNITHVTGNSVWRVEFAIKFCTVNPCFQRPSGWARGPLPDGESVNQTDELESQIQMPVSNDLEFEQRKLGILSNRWSCEEQIDENLYTSRTYRGVVRLSNPNWNPMDFRAITIAPLTPGMMRTGITYSISEDNLSLQYSFTDKEVTVTAPKGAHTMQITHNESVVAGGAKAAISLRIHLTGNRYTPLYDLVLIAEAIATQRLFLNVQNIANNKAGIIVQRIDWTTEQGTDQRHSVTYVFTGERTAEAKAGLNPGETLRGASMKSLTLRPVRDIDGNTVLSTYNNVLADGNREGETPFSEGGIPALSCLHAKITTPCSLDVSFTNSVPSDYDVGARQSRETAILGSFQQYTSDELYNAYPYDITVEINDNIEDNAAGLVYSTAHQQYVYSHYNITSKYDADALAIPLPVAQTYGDVQVFNKMVIIGPPQYQRTIRIEAERSGKYPNLPSALPVFTEEGAYIGGGIDSSVTNTLISAKATHLNPAPVADGSGLMYTSYLDLVYSQNRAPVNHKFGVPAYITPTSGGDSPVTDTTKYGDSISNIFGLTPSISQW